MLDLKKIPELEFYGYDVEQNDDEVIYKPKNNIIKKVSFKFFDNIVFINCYSGLRLISTNYIGKDSLYIYLIKELIKTLYDFRISVSILLEKEFEKLFFIKHTIHKHNNYFIINDFEEKNLAYIEIHYDDEQPKVKINCAGNFKPYTEEVFISNVSEFIYIQLNNIEKKNNNMIEIIKELKKYDNLEIIDDKNVINVKKKEKIIINVFYNSLFEQYTFINVENGYKTNIFKNIEEIKIYLKDILSVKVVIKDNKDKEWYLNGKLHREDGPAVEKNNGNKWWYLHGERHRENGPAIEYSNGNKEWYINGKLHRENGPAIEWSNGDKWWYKNGKIHCDNGPAVEKSNGDKWWYLNGEYHRKNDPAVEFNNGDKWWYINGKLHREDGPAIEYNNGDKKWYLNGKCHRENGPAVEYNNGTKEWYLHGELHRENGPAVEYNNGTKSWYLNGKRHRENGPAVEKSNGDKEWWLNNVKQERKKIIQIYEDDIKIHNINSETVCIIVKNKDIQIK